MVRLNDNNPLVSIMMPVYNGRRLIEASIQSIMDQSYTNWECIIVDDGSIDRTKEYINELPLIDQRFRIIHHPYNKGRSDARQTALDAATGKYLAMLDAEDLWHPKKLETQVMYMETHEKVALITCGMISFGTRTGILRERGYQSDELIEFMGSNVPIHASSMLRLAIAKNYKYDSTLKLGEDADFLKRYLANRTYATQKESYYYYSEFDSVSKKKIVNTYTQILSKKLRYRNYLQAVNILIKLVVFYFFSPFIPIATIIKARGDKPQNSDIEFFENNIRPLIFYSIKQ